MTIPMVDHSVSFKQAMQICEAQADELEALVLAVLGDSMELTDEMMNIVERRARLMRSLWCIDYAPPTDRDMAAINVASDKAEAAWLEEGNIKRK